MNLSKKSWVNRYMFWFYLKDYIHRTYGVTDEMHENNKWMSMPKTLCSYFWSMIFSLLFAPVALMTRGLLKWVCVSGGDKLGSAPVWKILANHFVMLFSIALVYWVLELSGYGYYYHAWEQAPGIHGWEYIGFFFNGIAVWAFALSILFIVGIIFYHIFHSDGFVRDRLLHSINFTPRAPRKNILWEYIKARKQKVCPMINYED